MRFFIARRCRFGGKCLKLGLKRLRLEEKRLRFSMTFWV
jgi:hypothetical protein